MHAFSSFPPHLTAIPSFDQHRDFYHDINTSNQVESAIRAAMEFLNHARMTFNLGWLENPSLSMNISCFGQPRSGINNTNNYF